MKNFFCRGCASNRGQRSVGEREKESLLFHGQQKEKITSRLKILNRYDNVEEGKT